MWSAIAAMVPRRPSGRRANWSMGWSRRGVGFPVRADRRGRYGIDRRGRPDFRTGAHGVGARPGGGDDLASGLRSRRLGGQGGQRFGEFEERLVPEGPGHRGRAGHDPGAARPGGLVHARAGAEVLREARRPGRHDHRPVCGRHDRARHRAPPRQDGRRGTVSRDDIVDHRHRGRRGARMAGASAGRVLPGHVPGRDTSEGRGDGGRVV